MRPDPARVELTRSWLEKAREDLDTARWIFQREPPIIPTVLYHCQQAVEKALKAFLAWHDARIDWTHDLGELCEQCFKLDPALRDEIAQVIPLSKYAWKFRYPGNYRVPPYEEVVKALTLAEDVMKRILLRLPGEVAP